ncbi:MAG: creatininase family protein [Alphaproteobacteria bacterium]
MQLQFTTWPEVERYLERSRGIVIPIGSTEQHGPTGLIGTDALTAQVIAGRVGEAADAMVAPTISYGMAQHHMAFAGTVTLRPSTLILVVRDVVVSLARHGFERFFFINGHGGNIVPVKTAFSEIHNELAELAGLRRAGSNTPPGPVRLALHNWWEAEPVARMRRDLYGDKEGQHATPSEVAVTWYAFPDQQREGALDPIQNLPPKIEGPDEYRARYPDGRMSSDPSLANAEDGQKLVEAATAALAERYAAFLTEN